MKRLLLFTLLIPALVSANNPSPQQQLYLLQKKLQELGQKITPEDTKKVDIEIQSINEKYVKERQKDNERLRKFLERFDQKSDQCIEKETDCSIELEKLERTIKSSEFLIEKKEGNRQADAQTELFENLQEKFPEIAKILSEQAEIIHQIEFLQRLPKK